MTTVAGLPGVGSRRALPMYWGMKMDRNNSSMKPAHGPAYRAAPRLLYRVMAAAVVLSLSSLAAAQSLPEDVKYAEDFENGTGEMSVRLGNYSHSPYTPYSADPYWQNYGNCNGVIVRYASTNASSGFSAGDCANPSGTWNDALSGAASRNNVRRLADALGQVDAGVAASSPTTRRNHALTAWTTFTDGAADQKQFETSPVNLGGGMRFYTARVDIAEASCDYSLSTTTPWGSKPYSPSQLHLFLVSGGVEHSITDQPIVACADSRAANYSSPGLSANVDGGLEFGPGNDGWEGGGATVKAGRFYSDAVMKLPNASSVQVRLRNRTGYGDGNDAAIDNIVITDATPKLAKQFQPGSIPAGGGSTTMVFTIQNRPDGLAKTGWKFTDTLQNGLTLANTTVGGTCTNYTNDPGSKAALTGTAGGNEITIAGSLPAGLSCTVEVQVDVAATVASGSSLQNCAADLSALEYLDGPDSCATLQVTPAADLSIVKTAAATVASGSMLRYDIVVKNAGPDAADGALVRDIPDAGLDCSTGSGATLTCAGNGCPAGPLSPEILTSTGIALASFAKDAEATFSLTCKVTASGL